MRGRTNKKHTIEAGGDIFDGHAEFQSREIGLVVDRGFNIKSGDSVLLCECAAVDGVKVLGRELMGEVKTCKHLNNPRNWSDYMVLINLRRPNEMDLLEHVQSAQEQCGPEL